MQRYTTYSNSPTRSYVQIRMKNGRHGWVELKLSKDTDGYTFTAVDQGWGGSPWFRDDMVKTFSMDRAAAVQHLSDIVKAYEATGYVQLEVLTCRPGRRPTDAERHAQKMLEVANNAVANKVSDTDAGARVTRPHCGCVWHQRGIVRNVGTCLNTYECEVCGATDTIDSSG